MAKVREGFPSDAIDLLIAIPCAHMRAAYFEHPIERLTGMNEWPETAFRKLVSGKQWQLPSVDCRPSPLCPKPEIKTLVKETDIKSETAGQSDLYRGSHRVPLCCGHLPGERAGEIVQRNSRVETKGNRLRGRKRASQQQTRENAHRL